MQLTILLWWARKELRPLGVDWDEFLDSIHVIARLERGRQTDLFFKKDSQHYQIQHLDRPLLSTLDSKSTLLLYEPCVSKDEIQDCGITDGRVWATVSPLPERYKEFSKASAIKYMECPNEDELLFMASVLDNGLKVDNPLKVLFKRDSVLERIRLFGPFLRPVLPKDEEALQREVVNQKKVLSGMKSEDVLKAWDISENNTTGVPSMSHYILRISPIVDDQSNFGDYILKATSNQVKERLGDLLFKTDVKDLRKQLATYNQNPDKATPAAKGTIPTVLETFFVKHAIQKDDTRWKNWMVATTKFSLGSSTGKWEPFSLNVTEINSSKNPTYADIVAAPGMIFYMNDSIYPFVDYFWYDSVTETVNAGQASKSFSGHPKTVETCQKMLENLQMPPNKKLVINMIPLPSQAAGYLIGTTSKFFSNVGSDAAKIQKICEELEFHVIRMVL
ncbi:hypothetical protein HK100_005906 [Physocladia obscura]|uniref:Uncharacterized protein n=1 Tax=Physocladia obscura TaxID=109957 RepID=A0AAD5XC03_9FUNG|nr:hypothetical protein HK100_005906 [Physocladia obscura]